MIFGPAVGGRRYFSARARYCGAMTHDDMCWREAAVETVLELRAAALLTPAEGAVAVETGDYGVHRDVDRPADLTDVE